MLTISNTETGKKEVFNPIDLHHVTMYVCGITPYDDAHIGHGRCYVSFDVLYRVLKSLGYDVRYCRNLTDIDDKILNKAEKDFGDKMRYALVTEPVVERFREDMSALNCLPPDYEPRVTENIESIINFVKKLVEQDKAYVSNGDVYFRIRSFPQYGKLSKHKLDDLRAGSRVDVSEKKEDPLDFALWKSEQAGTFWKSPWGYGRPGWHIECSALASKYLAEEIDIHAGGQDLIFPHHENEIAQTEALTGKPFAKYWVHNGFVRINKEKMSKSLGNFFTLRQVFEKYNPMVIRFYFLNHHYRAPLDFAFEDIDSVQKSYYRLAKIFADVDCAKVETKGSVIVERMHEILLDDLNTPGMLGVLFESLDKIKNDVSELCAVKKFLEENVGLTFVKQPEIEIEITPEIAQLIEARDQARAAKDWARADALRDQLRDLGFNVQDRKL